MGKKQHFVPRLLLRSFSSDSDRKTINIFLLKHSRLIIDGGLYNQAYGQHLYGSDQVLENTFQQIEAGFSSALKKLSQGDVRLTPEEDAFTKIFIILQRNRTPSAANAHNAVLDANVKNLASHDSKFKNKLDRFSVSLSDPFPLLVEQASRAAKYLSDLRVGLLENEASMPFVIGEHPVVILNPFLFEKKWHGSKQGIGVKGTFIVMPISPQKTLAMYDPVRYKLSNFKRIINVSGEDVDKLNLCQFLQTSGCIYCDRPIDIDTLKDLAYRSQEYRIADKADVKVYKQKTSKKARKYSEIVMSGTIDLPIDQRFGFIGLRDLALLDDLGPTMDIRREVHVLHEELFAEDLP